VEIDELGHHVLLKGVKKKRNCLLIQKQNITLLYLGIDVCRQFRYDCLALPDILANALFI
jgi:hypothetical protein